MVALKVSRGCFLALAFGLPLVRGAVFEAIHWLGSGLRADQSTEAPPTCDDISDASTGLFLFGGGRLSDGERSSLMFLFDLKNNQICPIEPVPDVIQYAEGMVLNGKPTVCGGFANNQCYDYDPNRPTNSHWSVISNTFTSSSSRPYMRMVSVGVDQALLTGGANSGTTETISLSSTGIYANTFALPDPLSRMCALSLNSTHIFVAGGFASGVGTDKAYLFDTTDGSTEYLASMDEARYGMRCQFRANGAGGQEIVVVGGRLTNGPLSTTTIYDIARNEWRDGAPFLFPIQYYAGLLAFDNDLYLLGGYGTSDSTDRNDAIWKLSQTSSAWTKVTDLIPQGFGRVAMSVPVAMVVMDGL